MSVTKGTLTVERCLLSEDQPHHLTSVGEGTAKDGDWRKTMDGGQEHLTEWNLVERVELGVEYVTVSGGSVEVEEEICRWSK